VVVLLIPILTYEMMLMTAARLEISVSGEVILDTEDPQPLGPGHLAFRIRGLSEEPAACLIRNVTVESS